MRTLKPVGAVSRALLVALIVVLLAAVFAIWKYWSQPPTKPETEVGRGVAQAFLDKVREGRAGEAWDGTTAEFKSIEGRESFIRSSAKRSALKQQLHFASMQNVQVKDQSRAEYVFQSADGKMVRVLVGYDAGEWKVDRLTQ